MAEKRCLAISYSPKVYTFAKDNGLPYIDIDRLEEKRKHYRQHLGASVSQSKMRQKNSLIKRSKKRLWHSSAMT